MNPTTLRVIVGPFIGHVIRRFRTLSLARCCVNVFTDQQKNTLKAWQSEHRWSPNRLRHAAATEIRREVGLEEAQIILGHSRADVTQIYA